MPNKCKNEDENNVVKLFTDKVGTEYDKIKTKNRMNSEEGGNRMDDNSMKEFKDEMRAMRTDMNNNTNAIRTDMNNNINSLRSEMTENTNAIRAEINANNIALRTEITESNSILRTEINENTNSLRTEMQNSISKLPTNSDVKNMLLENNLALNEKAKQNRNTIIGWTIGITGISFTIAKSLGWF